MKFILTMTEDIIKKSLMCGHGGQSINSQNCAFAIAFNELVSVTVFDYTINFLDRKKGLITIIETTSKQRKFIELFDSMKETPERRLQLIGLEFEIEIPDNVIDYWYSDISEVTNILNNSKSLVLC